MRCALEGSCDSASWLLPAAIGAFLALILVFFFVQRLRDTRRRRAEPAASDWLGLHRVPRSNRPADTRSASPWLARWGAELKITIPVAIATVALLIAVTMLLSDRTLGESLSFALPGAAVVAGTVGLCLHISRSPARARE